ncbi:MAG TPA: VWA domain-containing protein [Terriglobales bacterium]|nr:VWA domain-containing protein [Terriglobales bacterium]
MLFRSSRPLWVAVLCLALLAGIVPAQTPAMNGNDPAETISVNVRVVNVFFNVRDKRGQFVPNLPKSEFRIAEDKVAQRITYFSADPNAALTIGLLVDTSPSQRKVLGYEQQVGKNFLHDVLRPQDSAMIAEVDSAVRIIQDFTSDQKALQAAIDRVKTGEVAPGIKDPHAGNGQLRATIVRDAIHILAEQKFERETGRKSLIILTDGQDFGSQLDIKEAIRAAQLGDVICYVLLIQDPNYYFSVGYDEKLTGESEMKKLAKETGGKVIKVGAKIERLRAAFDLIANELRHHYSIGYVASNRALDGTFRHIAITTEHPYKIQVRQGYYAKP